MIPNDDKISSFQLGAYVYLTILGVGIFTLPATLTKYARNDAWMLCILAGLVDILFIYLMCKVGKRFSSYGFVGTLRTLFGKLLGTILAIPSFVYFLSFSAFEVRLFAETTKMYLLYRTPIEFIILPLLLLAVLLARRGIEPMVRFFEISVPIILIIVVLIIIISISKSDYSRLLPALRTPLPKYFKGITSSVFSFAGFEVLLVVFPYLRKPERAFKASAIAFFSIILLYTIITIQCIVRLGVSETENLLYPTASLMRASEVPGLFLERLEGLFISIWVLFVFTTVTSFIYIFSVIGSDLVKHREKNHIISMFIPIMYIITLQGNNIKEVMELSDKVNLYVGYYTIFILPIVMFVTSLIRRKAGNKNEC